MKYKIGFIGSGNVAWHLAHAVDLVGHTVVQVISRTEENAFNLAKRFGAHYSNNLASVDLTVDLLLLCVSDDEIENVVAQLPRNKCIVAHTCGSRSLEDVADCSPNHGVFYPLQTFSKNRDVDMLSVPFLLEASNNQSYKVLEDIADSISNNVRRASSKERLQYHLAAVFANNFANHMFDKAAQFLADHKLDFDVLRPIILETAQKVQQLSPADAQTGPAKRGDEDTLAKHQDLLLENKDILELYNLLSDSLRNQ